MNLVPADCCNERIPCRHISLNAEGYTIDTYYRLGTQEEVEAATVAWLRKIIEHLTALLAPAVNRESDSRVRSSAPSSRPG